MKKFSWLLILSLCVAMISVPAFNLNANAAPGDLFDAVGDPIYSQNFDSLTDATDGEMIKGYANSPAIAADGSLQLTSVNSAQTVWDIYFNTNKTALGVGEGNIYCIDFDLKKPNTSTASYIQIGDSGDKLYRTYIHGNDDIVPNQFTNIKFIVNAQSGTKEYKYLVGNKLVDQGTGGRNIQFLRMVNNASSYSYYIDNFSVYKISQSDYENACVFWAMDDAAVLGENTSADAITKDLAFTDGITWTSSNEAVISNDGKVSREMVWPSTTVTVTAKATDKLSKQFTFKVLRKDIEAAEGMTGDYYVYDDFENSTEETNGINDPSNFGEIRDGKFYFTNNASGEANFDYYFKAEKTGTATIGGGSDVFAVEFDVKKELASSNDRSSYYIRVLTYNGYRYYAQNYIKASSSETAGASGKSYYDASVNHFKYIIDTINGTYSLYINGVLENYETTRNTKENPYVHLQGIKIVNQTPGSTLSLDNVKVYKLSEKTYKTGYNNYGITKLGVTKDAVDEAGTYAGNISYLATGLSEAPSENSLPVCYVAKYVGNELDSVAVCPAKLVTYSEADGVYGWWFPDAYAEVSEEEIGNTSIKAFVWNGVTPVDNHIVAKAANEE